MTQTDFNPDLSFVTLADDGYTLLLNGESNYSVRLPMDISRKKAADRLNAIEFTIRNVCNTFGLNTVNSENIKQRAEEALASLEQRWASARGAESITSKSKPNMEAVKIPPLTDYNAWAKWWFFDRGVNVIPAKTAIKKTWIHWKEEGYQTNPIPEEKFQEWINNNEFKDGLAVMAGKVWRGPNTGKYFTLLDLDNQLAIDEFCKKKGRMNATLQEISKRFIVEQHPDNPYKAHIYFYSEIPFVVKASDNGKPGFNENSMPSFEVKGLGTHGVSFCTPSFHKGGKYRYEIIGTTEPITLEEHNAKDLMLHIHEICKRYGLHYLNDANDVSDTEGGKPTVADLVKEGSVILAGNNRHNGLVKMGMSVYSYLRGKYPLSTIKEIVFRVLNDIYCVPPLDKKEFEGNVWKSILRYIPPEQKYEGSAQKHLQEIASDTGLDPNKVLEKPLVDVIRQSSGQHVVSRVKIVGVSPPYKLISKVTIKCPQCFDITIEDYSKMPYMSYKLTKKQCSACKIVSDPFDLSVQYDHVDAKSITLQDAEMRDDLERLHVILLETLTRNVRVGETATITGDVTVLNPTGAGNKKPSTVMYAVNIKYDREEESPITDDDILLFHSFVKEHGADTSNELVKMFAPQVMGHSDAKLGLLRSAVNVRETKQLTGIRSRTHTNLAGAKGTAKSTLAEEATKIVPNSRWVTAQHVSIKSVLAIIDKDPDGGKMLMLGAVPQARNALCGINEMGSMPFEDQQHFADIMEEGRFTKDQHGIYQEIESPTTIIATTNPEGGHWNGTPSIDQIPIRSNIKDRFDQTYIFEDFKTDEERREYVMFKAELYQNPPQTVDTDYDFLKRYLQYAAFLPDPVLTAEAGTMLSDFWMRMSRAGHASNRSYDSLIRIARGQARLQLKTEIDAEVARQIMQDMQLMFVKLGKLVDPSVESPIETAYNEVIQYTNTLEAPITLEEALKHVASVNNSVKQYLGGNNIDWSIDRNKRYRNIHDRFADDAVIGQIKTGRNGLAVTIDKLKPLTIVKSDKEAAVVKQHHQQQQEAEIKKGSRDMQSNRSDRSVVKKEIGESEREFPATDPTDPTDRPSEGGQFNFDMEVGKYTTPPKPYQLVEKAMRCEQGDNKGFKKDDWVYTCMIWPNLHWTEDQAEQALYALIEEGKIQEIPDKPELFEPTSLF